MRYVGRNRNRKDYGLGLMEENVSGMLYEGGLGYMFR
jgi:hypothetical protein